MATQMEINYEAIKHPGATLKESVDIIRTSVKDLYSLDEDNYQQIKILKAELKKATDRLDKLTSASQGQVGRNFLRIVLLGGIVFLVIRELKEYCDKLRARIEALEKGAGIETCEETEESDG